MSQSFNQIIQISLLIRFFDVTYKCVEWTSKVRPVYVTDKVDNSRGLPESTKTCPNIVLILDHRLRCWSNIKTTLGECFAFAGLYQ